MYPPFNLYASFRLILYSVFKIYKNFRAGLRNAEKVVKARNCLCPSWVTHTMLSSFLVRNDRDVHSSVIALSSSSCTKPVNTTKNQSYLGLELHFFLKCVQPHHCWGAHQFQGVYRYYQCRSSKEITM